MDDKNLPGRKAIDEQNFGGYRESEPVENAVILSENDGALAEVNPETGGEGPMAQDVERARPSESNKPESPIGETPNPKKPSATDPR